MPYTRDGNHTSCQPFNLDNGPLVEALDKVQRYIDGNFEFAHYPYSLSIVSFTEHPPTWVATIKTDATDKISFGVEKNVETGATQLWVCQMVKTVD